MRRRDGIAPPRRERAAARQLEQVHGTWRISGEVGGENALEILLAVDTQWRLAPHIINLFYLLIRLPESESKAKVHADVSLAMNLGQTFGESRPR